MKNLVDTFLTEDDRSRITGAVKKAEKTTSGEIVPMAVSSSGNYPLAGVIGAMALSVPLSLAGTYCAAHLVKFSMSDMWIFLGIEAALFTLAYLLVINVSWLKRMFIPAGEIDEEVRRAALMNFYLSGLHRTRDETGVLIYVSIFERKVWVLGDRGINEKVGQDSWKEIVSIITEGIKNEKQGDAICRAVERAGEILKNHFPIRPGDRDELPNLIAGE